MEFDGQYLTYSEYQSFGGTLEEMPFNLLEFKARKEIDRATSMKLVGKGQNYTSVKVCIYPHTESGSGPCHYTGKLPPVCGHWFCTEL